MDRPPIYFYYPPGAATAAARDSVHVFAYREGAYVWTVKTYGALAGLGFRCRLTDQLPEEGIIVSHRQSLPNEIVPNDRQLFVCIVADFYRHPSAQLHLVQNPRDPMLMRPSHTWPAVFLPSWPEAGLIRRDPARGDAFVNVSYYGLPQRLAPQLRGERFARLLQEQGFDFQIIDRHHWNDYSETDAVLAVRSFAKVSYHKYPSSKLYNSWIAGVPALLGRESAYQAERRNAYDYFEVASVSDTLRTLERLRSDRALRAAIARNCAERAAEVSEDRIAARWVEFLLTVAVPAYDEWRGRSASSRRAFLRARRLAYAAFACRDFVVRAEGFALKEIRAALP
ncbi:MAG TPA: hypothetical protein VGQ22_24965 [Steroidobacteraceae bacterium]|nr:hypothetical protein [Steroidobacteraceae bacterium]